MPIPRFYCPTPLNDQETLSLADPLAHHAVRVLRLKDGAEVTLFNGEGGETSGVLQIEGKRAYVVLGSRLAREAELRGHVTLVQGLPSGDKMDWIVEKAVELGVTHLVPIAADRSVLQLSGDRLAKRMTHWQRIAQSASEQCGRNRLLRIDPPRPLRDWLETPHEDLRLMAHPDADRSLNQALAGAPAGVALMVGPEGGWSQAEQALAMDPAHAVMSMRWGERVLRTETAGLALTAAATALLDWV